MRIPQLSPARIARSLVAILVLTLIQTGLAPFSTNTALAYTQGTPANGTSYGGTGGNANGANQNCSNGAIVAIGTTKLGNALRSFMFVCKTVNNDASLSASEVTTNVFETPSESDRCAAGQIGIGIRVIASNGGTLVGGVGLICGNPVSGGNQNIRSIMPDASAAGTVYTFTCATGQLLAGFSLRTGAAIDQITPKCSTFSAFNYAAVGAPTATVTGNAASVSFAAVTGSIADTALTYTVSAVPNSGATITVTGNTSPISVPGLVIRANYTITVTASNSYGTSPATSSTSATMALPGSDTDTALSLNGSNQWAQVSDTTGSPYDLTGNITLMAWVNPATSCSSDQGVISKDNSYLLYCGAGKWAHSFSPTGAGWSGSGLTSITVQPNEWHHIAYVHTSSSTSMKVYYDGVFVENVTTGASTMTPNNNALNIGRYSGLYGFNGKIDEARIYSTARTAAQILNDMNTYGPVSDSDLVAYYDMNEGSGSTIYNRKVGSTSATDLTTSGSPTWPDVKIVDTTTLPAHTQVIFPRSYLTSSGGWRVPSGVTRASLIVTGGGGGAGAGSGQNIGPAGAGGGGGVTYIPTATLIPGAPLAVKVGQGGRGDTQTSIANDAPTRNGLESNFGGYIALGGGGGGSVLNGARGAGSGVADTSIATGGGSSGADFGPNGGNGCATSGAAGGVVATGYNGGFGVWGWGGSGGGARGAASNGTCANQAGIPGLAFVDPLTSIKYGQGGYGDGWEANNLGFLNPVNNGWGGSPAYNSGASTGNGFSGAAGIIIVRWITAAKPIFTQPANTFLNVGMTETFTTNVALDSATVGLTRTFRWESTTAGAGGPYTTIKQGTGAANAFFAWVPPDTATTGSNFLFRVIVTDSDTAGLFIQETSTAVFATINGTLRLTGKSTITKTVGISKTETFTVTSGTPTYRYTFTNNNSLITLDTSTVGSPRIRLADTITVGTYSETLTLIDSVSATIVQPLTIVVNPPPSFSANGTQVDSGTVLYLDAGNIQSNTGTGALWKDISGRGLTALFPPSPAPAMNGVTGGLSCSAPTFSTASLGTLEFNGGQCGYVPNVGLLKVYTYEVWVKRSAAMTDYSAIISNPWSGASGQQLAISLHWMSNGTLQAGIYDGTTWSNVVNSPVITIGAWTHVAVTFSGSSITMTLDGNTAGKISQPRSVTWVDAKNDTGILIGKRFDANTDYFKGSMGSVRIYNRVLTDAEILQNYNATSGRFLLTQNKQSVAGKYGTTINETYTVTAGSETITAAFTSSAVAGLRWDTSTVRSMRVQLQDSLTAGTYNDTITVTDIYGSSTRISLTITVAKADTITVTMDTATVTTFNGSPITVFPKPVIRGLMNSDTATVTTKFSSASYSLSASPPTNSDTYTVTATDLTMVVGTLNNYLGWRVETSTARINKASQAPLYISTYVAVVGSPFTITVLGGTGGGAISETLTGVSTAPNCQINNRVLTSSATTTSYCQIKVTSAESQNYLAESVTALVYFMEFVFNQPAPSAGSGPNVALTGENDVTVDIDLAPMISSLSTYAATAGVTSLLINGVGFNGSDPLFELKFWRGIAGTGYTINPAKTQISVTVPAGTRTGKVTVITSKGLAVSEFPLVIAP